MESDEDGSYFEIELPGVSKDGMSIEVVDNKLVVSGRRFKKHRAGKDDTIVEEEGEEGKEATMHASTKKDTNPRLVYLFQARLAHGADVDAIKADLGNDGILTVAVPIRRGYGPRRIPIPM